jgi:predicted amidohydrolase
MFVARAAENRVFMATCHRVGKDKEFCFIGKSKIIDPEGKILASAGDDEEVIRAEIDLSQARQKRTRVVPGKYEMTVFASRRPELYGELMDESLNVEELGEG